MRLSQLFLSEIRAELFVRLFGVSPKPFYLNQLVRETKFASRSIEEELSKLKELELIVATRDGNRVYYAANQQHPIYPDLRNLVLKTAGLHDILEQALRGPLIEFAFVFGSIAHGSAQAESDVDLMIVGTITGLELAERMRGVAEQVGRAINPHIFGRDEIAERVERRDHFLSDVVSKPKLFIIGNENEFNGMVASRLAPPAQG